ncbi:MAG: tRNA (adenine(22)-N(1))-methyltransferase [Bacilli bacterium]
MIKISKRLEVIASFIENQDQVIDIGCDHALLDIYLYQTKNIKVIGTDINKRALEQAKRNLNKYKLSNQIELKLVAGLNFTYDKSINTIIISGLGFSKIKDILFENLTKLDFINKIIIQSNTKPFKTRQLITKLGYYIEKEKLVFDNKIIYLILLFKKGQKKYTKEDLFFGPLLRKERSSLFLKDLEDNIMKKEYLLEKIPLKYTSRRKRLEKELAILKKEKTST